MKKYGIVLYLLALMAYVFAGVPLTPFHGDESTLIYGSRDYFEQFVTPDMTRIMNLRDDDPMDHNLRLLDGRVQTYFGAFAYHLTGGTQAGLNQPWLWGAGAQYNVDNGHVPTDDLLMAQRYAMALLMALSVPAAYGIGTHVGGMWGGLLMATLLALSPNLVLNGRRAMMEAPLLLFSLLTVLSALNIVALRNISSTTPPNINRRFAFWALLLAISAGMALSSKHTAVFTLVPVFGALGLWLLRRREWRHLVWIIGAGVAAIGLYFAMNPAWWAAPFDTAREMMALRAELLESQTAGSGGYANIGDYARGFMDYAILERPQYFEVGDWEEVGTTIAEYESTPFVISPLVNTIRAAVTFILAIFGTWALIKRWDAVSWLVWLWVLFTLAAVFFLTPLPWARYYLPALPVIYTLAAAGIGSRPINAIRALAPSTGK